MAVRRASVILALGLLLLGLGVAWFFHPPSSFDGFCLETPCAMSYVAAGITSLIGIALVTTGWVGVLRAQRSQTVTIAINQQAQQDAEMIDVIRQSVKEGKNPDTEFSPPPEMLAQIEAKRVDPQHFAQLPKDEVHRGTVKHVAKKKKK